MHRLDSRHDFAILTPEQPDDLWTLRRVIAKGDLVKSETTRVLKETAEYARPDKERVKVTLTVEVEQVKLDATLSRIRVGGKIVDVSNDLLGKGTYHSISVSEGHRLAIKKPSGFSAVQLKLIQGSNVPQDRYFLVALDGREAGVGIVSGTHLQQLPTVESGATGKMYDERRKSRVGSSNYYEKIADLVASSSAQLQDDDERVRPPRLFIVGPGTTKNAFANYLMQNRSKQFPEVKVVDGLDVAGEDGIYTAIRSPNLQDALGGSRLAKASRVLQEAMRRISLNDPKVAISFKDNFSAARAGSVESLLISDKIFSRPEIGDEDAIVELLNSVDEYRGETFLLDSSTDLGEQVNTLGGAVGLLRFSV